MPTAQLSAAVSAPACAAQRLMSGNRGARCPVYHDSRLAAPAAEAGVVLHARRNARQAGSRFLTPSFFCCLFSYGSCAWHPSLWLRLCTRYPSCVCIDSVGSIVFSLKLMVSLMLELSPFVVTKTYYSLQKWQIEQIGVSLSWIRFSLLTPSWSLYATGKGWI
jgi:hypothetical protein